MNNFLSNFFKIKNWIYTSIAIAAFVVVGYMFAVLSEPYNVVVSSLKDNIDIRSKIGLIESVWLSPIDYKISYTGDSGNARFKIYAKGNEGLVNVAAKLKKTEGRWEIIETIVEN